jgi:uncharacterized protein (TIGR00251 family)
MKIYIKVKPNSSKQEIKKISEKEYLASLKNSPEENKANLELIKIMKRYLKKNVRIITGLRSRKKILEVENGD